MDIPESMRAELAAWNNGKGIDLRSWTGCEGRFALAVGYASIFWPEFVEFDGYILPKGFSEEHLRGFERREGATRKSVEAVMNHLQIADIQHVGCKDISKDKLLALGNTLREIYEAKLRWQFPDKPCVVVFLVPDDENDLYGYQIEFWQHCQEEA
jgi:hypothetical protein